MHIDFETYSEADYTFDAITGKWVTGGTGVNKGIRSVGAAVYSEHPTTEVLMLAYGDKLWLPGMPPPFDLFRHIAAGGLIEAANSGFEYLIWNNVCVKRMNWPPLPLSQMRCTLAKARAYSLPGSLGDAAIAINAPVKKMTEGKRLIQKFCVPRKPTIKDQRLRMPVTTDDDSQLFKLYCIEDVAAEACVDALVPSLSQFELDVWMLDQRINMRGVAIDTQALEMLGAAVEGHTAQLVARLPILTDGVVNDVTEVAATLKWLATRKTHLADLTKDTVAEALEKELLPPDVREVLEIRAAAGSASVKKIPAIKRRLCSDNRVRDILSYAGADRTGRWAGRGPQPQNLPNKGPKVDQCMACGAVQSVGFDSCHNCGPSEPTTVGCGPEAVDTVMSYDLARFKDAFNNPIAVAAGCLRGLFVAAEGHDFISSDYSAIEAVVLACLAREQWRIDVFKTHGKIYEMTASDVTGIPFDEILAHKERTGDHHPARKSHGKVGELASGYQGGIGAWKTFGADEFLTDAEIKDAIAAWRAASPNIVNFWYNLERAAVAAIKSPYVSYPVNDVAYVYDAGRDVLQCVLPSGRRLNYHNPRLKADVTPWGAAVEKITFMGVHAKTKKWVRHETYGGKLCENITQAVARDLLAFALINVDAAGYHVVLHIHDEIVSEVPHGFGSVAEFESIMARVPDWAHSWPVKAAGGWRGRRYRKD